ncbi:oligosaccharide flippase family protein [Candidatus Woesearchaeota archaeon]|nr:oligosaccharide flippase family protein [Candidatus Woesearchaeota archaeon]
MNKNKRLIKENLILFLAITFANLLNYLFHFYVGRILGPEEYGVFGVLLSIVYLLVMPLMAVQTIFSKYVAELKVDSNEKKISYLFYRSFRKILFVGIIFSIIFLMISPFLSHFLKIGSVTPLIILGISITFIFLIPLLRGFIQGLQNFPLLGATFISEGLTKVILGVPLVLLGFGITGAIGAFAISFFLPFIILSYFLRKMLTRDREKFDTSKIYGYSFLVIIMLVSLTGFYTTDLILVKLFLDPIEAGYYAALSLFGKIIFFASMSISMVMFPKLSELNLQKKDTRTLLLKSVLIAVVLGGIISLFYFLIPTFIIGLLFGGGYLLISNLLWIFGIMMTIYSIVYLLSYYNMALHRESFLYLLFSFNLLQTILIILFHKTITQVVVSLIIVMSLLFLGMVVYTLKNEKSIDNYSGI